MVLQLLTPVQKTDAMKAAASDIKYHFAEIGVDEELQSVLFHNGFTSMRMFAGIDETKAGLRTCLRDDLGLDYALDLPSRKRVAVLLAAWESCKEQVSSDDKHKADARSTQTPRLLQSTELAAMRTVVEQSLGRLRDHEIPSRVFIALRLTQVDENDPRLEDLRDVTSHEDVEVDAFTGSVDFTPDRQTGVMKLRTGKSTIPLPQTPEELRLVHRRIGISWMMIAAKHSNRTWALNTTVEHYRRLSDHVLGKLVAGLAVKAVDGSVLQTPSWTLVLSYDAEVRKKAYELIREGLVVNIAEGLLAACKDSTVMQIHFLTPLTLTQGGGAKNVHAAPPGNDPGSPGKRARKTAARAAAALLLARWPAGKVPQPKGKGKGKGKGAGKGGRRKVNDKGQPICFKFNNGEKCPAGCSYSHECQHCGGAHPASSCEAALTGDTRTA
jgi:hypothetical protein